MKYKKNITEARETLEEVDQRSKEIRRYNRDFSRREFHDISSDFNHFLLAKSIINNFKTYMESNYELTGSNS